MRQKLIIEIDGIITTRVATVKDNVIEYKEAGNVYVKLVKTKDTLQIIKHGDINLDFTHKLNETRFLKFSINMNGQEFLGKNKIKTTHLIISDEEIVLDFDRDGDLIKSSYKLVR